MEVESLGWKLESLGWRWRVWGGGGEFGVEAGEFGMEAPPLTGLNPAYRPMVLIRYFGEIHTNNTYTFVCTRSDAD